MRYPALTHPTQECGFIKSMILSCHYSACLARYGYHSEDVFSFSRSARMLEKATLFRSHEGCHESPGETRKNGMVVARPHWFNSPSSGHSLFKFHRMVEYGF
jgi:hypothetical protein